MNTVRLIVLDCTPHALFRSSLPFLMACLCREVLAADSAQHQPSIVLILQSTLASFFVRYNLSQDVDFPRRGGNMPCRALHAVKAATRHTSEAHMVIVANGFKLDSTLKTEMVSGLTMIACILFLD